MIKARALHYVFRIGDRAKNINFYKNVLGMQVLRHEEFTEGCDAQCNGPYENRWSKTMIGYGPESNHFVIELTYNYGKTSYDFGNDFDGITIRSNEIIQRAKEQKYPSIIENGLHVLYAPDGYKFYVLDEPQPKDADPIIKVGLKITDLAKSLAYWNVVLEMQLLEKSDTHAILAYSDKQAKLELIKLDVPINRAEAYGRIAFAIPYAQQPDIEAKVIASNGKIQTPLVSLDTPGKATVRVIILADPDGHEICFVDDEGFSQLSAVDPNGDELLQKNIKRDPLQPK